MKMQIKAGDGFGKCGCGRSPTGKCIGWHGLTEVEFRHKQMLYLEEEFRKDNEAEQRKDKPE